MRFQTEYVPVKLPELIGKGYGEFWKWKGRYRVVKGSRASKKSKTTALWYIYNLMKYPLANLLVVRKTFRTMKDSCFTDLQWAVKRLGVEAFWRFRNNPLEAEYLPTGQKIYFRGLDDPLKITSIAVSIGTLCWLWIEEAYEVNRESDFDVIDESIRGEVPDGYFKQATLTFNPWNEKHWIKKRFFDSKNPEVLALTTTYLCNEWLDESDKRLFEDMKERNPRRYQVAGLGNWGIVEGVVYEDWEEERFELPKYDEDHVFVAGLDFGYTNDPSALFIGVLDKRLKVLYVWDEMYKTNMSNKDIYEKIVEMGYAKAHITADSAEPKSIKELAGMGLHIQGAKKGRDSVNNGIQWIQDLHIVVHPRCVNFLTEISNYSWAEDKFGKKINTPIDDFNHLMDAMRYALEEYIIKSKWIH